MTWYLLKEDGGRFVKEDEEGYIILERSPLSFLIEIFDRATGQVAIARVPSELVDFDRAVGDVAMLGRPTSTRDFDRPVGTTS